MEKINLSPDWVFSPQPMYIIGTKNEDGSPNFCIITWLGFSYDNGPCMMMTVGGTKLTQKNILREKRFSANMITEDTLWLADYFGNTNGENGQKNEIPYGYEWGKKVDVPIINECHWSYECEVCQDFSDKAVHKISEHAMMYGTKKTIMKLLKDKSFRRELNGRAYDDELPY